MYMMIKLECYITLQVVFMVSMNTSWFSINTIGPRPSMLEFTHQQQSVHVGTIPLERVNIANGSSYEYFNDIYYCTGCVNEFFITQY